MNKSRESSVHVVSVFNFSIILCYHPKSLLIISNFLKIDKVIVSSWYQNLDDKLIKECVRFKINMLQILVVARRHLKKSQIDKKYIDIKRKYKEEMGVNDKASAFMY